MHDGNVIDTTAELLGRAKPRKPRAKAPCRRRTAESGAPRRISPASQAGGEDVALDRRRLPTRVTSN